MTNTPNFVTLCKHCHRILAIWTGPHREDYHEVNQWTECPKKVAGKCDHKTIPTNGATVIVSEKLQP